MMICPEILKKAKWLWPNNSMYLLNCYAGFRYDFAMAELPSSAPLHISADQSYRLYVNGRYVCRGPVRGQQKNWQFDTVDIVSFLKNGDNFIAVEAYNPGISTFAYTHRDRAGFICAAKWDNGTEFFTNRDTWKMFRLSGYAAATGRLSVQMNYQEDLYLSLDDRSWIYSEKDPVYPAQEKWVRPGELAFGALPWTNMRPRVLPMFDERMSAPERAVCGGFGRTAVPPASAYNNIAWHFAENELPSIEWGDAPRFEKEGDFLCGTLPACGKGRCYAVTFDLGASWLPGTPVLEAENGRAGEIIDLYYYHYLPDGRAELLPVPGVGSLVALASRLHLGGGKKSRHEFFQIMGVRHVVLLVRETEEAVKVRLSWRSAVYPLAVSGDFSSSNAEIDAIYRICRHTQQVCSMDVFVDTPWREQSQWWGDARVQAKNTHFLTGDERLLEQGLFSIAEQPDAPHGLIFANAPTTQSGNILPDFCLTWVATLYDLYFQTGRSDFLKTLLPRAESVFAYFDTQRNADGIIAYDERFWLFEDWGDLPKKPYPCFLNLWHLLVLQTYEKLLAGAKMDTSAVSAKIENEKAVLVKAFFDPAQQLFMPVLDENGRQIGTPSVHDQVLAILAGVVPEAHPAMTAKRILPCLLGTLNEGVQPNAFWSTYLLDCAQKLGLNVEAVNYIRAHWKKMIDTSTTWEVFDRGDYTGWSYSHAWSAHPVTHLPEILGGINQTAPAWKRIAFKPFFMPGETHVAAQVATPHGVIKSSWQRRKDGVFCSLDLPPGIAADVEISGHRAEAAGHYETLVKE